MDDFNDLVWTSSSSSNNAPKPTAQTQPSYKLDSFSLLASTGKSQANYVSSSGPPSRSLTPSAPIVKPQTSNDAFGDLLAFGGSSKTTNNLSIAERQAQVERERLEKQRKEQQALRDQGAFWDTFEKPKSTPPPIRSTSSNSAALKPTPLATASKPPPASTSTPSSVKSSKAPAVSIWDFDLLAAPAPPEDDEPDLFAGFNHISNKPKSPSPAPRSSTPGDFDFGDREDRHAESGRKGLLGNNEGRQDDQDDILGLLGQPLRSIPKGQTPSPLPHQPLLPGAQPSPKSSPRPRTRSSSPPPHVIGRIVEMGFSVQQARVALAATDDGLNVEAAMEILLSQAGGSEREGSGDRRRGEDESRSSGREAEEAERRRRRRAGPARPSTNDEDAPRENTGTLGDDAFQKDKIIAQATEIGLNVFNRANAFWKTSKEMAAKAIEERSQSAASGSSTGKPKWMTESPGPHHDEDDQSQRKMKRGDPANETSFRDEEEEAAARQRARHAARRKGPQQPAEEVLPPRPTKPNPPREPERTGSLLSSLGIAFESTSSPSTPPAQPARRRTRPPEASANGNPAKSAPPLKPRRKRTLVTCSPSTLASSSKHRTKGATEYKLGQFAPSDSSFTSAIDLLPEGHMALIPLWNNRAQARLKIGDHAGAAQDCTQVIALVGTEYKEVEEEAISNTDENGPGVHLGEALAKAYSRRATAYEMAEKWEKAKEDWEVLAGSSSHWGTGAMKSRSDAVRGLERCKKMMGVVGGSNTAAAPAHKPVSKPRAAPTPAVSYEATKRLQAANAAAEAEETERYALKDTVDSRLVAWKGGKETNIRALIASLDSVLWPELGWVKVSIAELVTPQQVKIRYMKAIAKLHPDKVRNATVEQRMIANGVFGALNEAYNVFKP